MRIIKWLAVFTTLFAAAISCWLRAEAQEPISSPQQIEAGLVRLHTESENHWTDYQLNELDARLPSPPFFRAHRAVIVNLRKVKELAPFAKSTFQLLMNDYAATEIQVSERQAKKLRALLEL